MQGEYSEMNRILKIQSFSYRAQILSYIRENGNFTINEVGLVARKFKSNSVAIDKHLKKKVPTAKWIKRYNELQEEGINLFFRLMASVNMAHQYIFFRCNLFYLIENNLSLLEDISSKKDARLDNNFALLVKSIQIFDTTDKSNLLLFNRLRNVLCHTSAKQTANIFNETFMDELISLSDYIDSLMILAGNRYFKEMFAILDANIEAYFKENEYMKNPHYREFGKEQL